MIAIFPGHVGKDSGAIDNVHDDELYTVEAVINGQIAVRLEQQLLMAGFAARQYYGAFNDKVSEANKDQCNVGLSLHCDSLSASIKTRGMHTIIYPGSVAGRALAETAVYFWAGNCLNIPVHKDAPTENGELYILKNTKFPVVLIEMGFLTNHDDEKLLYNPNEQRRIANALCTSIVHWLDHH